MRDQVEKPLTLKQAAGIAGVSADTVARRCKRYGIGKQFHNKAPWRVDPVALPIVAEGDGPTWAAYRGSDDDTRDAKRGTVVLDETVTGSPDRYPARFEPLKRLTSTLKKWHFLRSANESRRVNRKLRRNSGRPIVPLAAPSANPRFPMPPTASTAPGQFQARGSSRRLFHYLRPPGVLSLRENYEAVADFFRHLRHNIYRDKISGELPRAIDFEALRSVSPAAALILAAELYRWQQFVGQRLKVIHQERWTPEVDQIFKSMGLFDFLETPNAMRATRADSDIEVLKYRSDTDVVGTKCEDLLQHLTEISGPLNAQNFIYDGLIEALKNSKQHAYSEPDQWFGVAPGTWFMSGSYQRSSKNLTAAVFDLGVGIPRTLPRATIWENLRPWLQLGLTDDGQMIAAAMEYGRTRTNMQGRGNGLPTMMRILDHHRGYLRIISGTGEAVYDSMRKVVEHKNHSVPIGGTLIEWSISR